MASRWASTSMDAHWSMSLQTFTAQHAWPLGSLAMHHELLLLQLLVEVTCTNNSQSPTGEGHTTLPCTHSPERDMPEKIYTCPDCKSNNTNATN